MERAAEGALLCYSTTFTDSIGMVILTSLRALVPQRAITLVAGGTTTALGAYLYYLLNDSVETTTCAGRTAYLTPETASGFNFKRSEWRISRAEHGVDGQLHAAR